METGESTPDGYHHVADAEVPGPLGRKSTPIATAPRQNESSKRGRALSSDDKVAVAKSTEDQRNLWNSIFFRRTTLSGFIILFILLIGALQIIYSYSSRYNGLSASKPSEHYLWTYGPTAVFVLLAILWRQLDYRAKQLMPWAEMARSPAPAEKSVLLDYTSPWLLIAFVKACKNRHFVITSTICGFFLIKVMTVVSTGLLVLQDFHVVGLPIQLSVSDKFDDGTFDGGMNVDYRPFYTVFGIQQLGLSYPFGTTDKYACQTFNSTTKTSPNSTLTATVDCFSADLGCETARVEYSSNWATLGLVHGLFSLNVTSPSCRIVGAPFSTPNNMATQKPALAAEGYYGQYQLVNCSNLALNDEPNRLLILFAYETRTKNNDPILNQTAAIICKPAYTISPGVVTIDDTRSMLNVASLRGHGSKQLPLATAWDLAYLFVKTAYDGQVPNMVNAAVFGSDVSPSITLDANFAFMALLHPHKPLAAYLEPSFLKAASQELFGSATSQIAKQFLMAPSNESILGNVDQIEQRLYVRQLPMRLVQGILGMLIVLTLVIWNLMPRSVIPRNPSGLGAISVILSRSMDFVRSLKGAGSIHEKDLRKLVEPSLYKTTTVVQNGIPSFRIEPVRRELSEIPAGTVFTIPRKPVHIEWWRPLAFKPYFRIFTLLSPLVLIAALEALYQTSSRNSGLADIHSNGYIRFVWVYIPTLFLVGVATLFNMLDFDVEYIQPYHVLHRGNSLADRSILSNQLGKITIEVLCNSARSRQISVFAAALAAVFAPMLTIVASGLYIEEYVPLVREVSVQPQGWFSSADTAPANAPYYTETSFVPGFYTSLLDGVNLSYPAWTHEELALSKVLVLTDVSNHGGNALPNNESSLSVRLPALRGAMNCSALGQDALQSLASSLDSLVGRQWRFQFATPGNCGSDGTYTFNTSDRQQMYMHVPDRGYFGAMVYSGDSCSLFSSGHASPNKIDNYTFLLCGSYLEQLLVDVTLNMPEYKIDLLSPPQPVENTAAFFSHASFDMEIKEPNIFQPLNNATEQYDGLFNHIIYGQHAVPPSHLLDPSILKTAVQHLYRIYAAQVLSDQFRTNSTTSSHNATALPPPYPLLNGTLTNPSRARLQQTALSTHLLEALLAVLFLCAAVVYLTLGDTRKGILAKNPGSIAAVASLLADSKELLSERVIPPGAEWMSDKELREKGVFKGLIFGLGWWGDDGTVDLGRGGKGKESGDGRPRKKRFGIDVVGRYDPGARSD